MSDRSLYPRVTAILHEGFAETGLEAWAVKEAMKKLWRLTQDGVNLQDAMNEARSAGKEIMQNAARRGTAVHQLIEGKSQEGKSQEELRIIEGDWESVEPMYKSFELWAKERNFKALANEVSVWSDKHGYKGTLDCIGEVDGVVTLLDWKTSNSIRLNYRLQLAAYWYAYKESQSDPLDTKLIRIVRFGGRSDKESQVKDLVTYEELIIDGEEDISIDFNAFLAAKRLYDWKLKRK